MQKYIVVQCTYTDGDNTRTGYGIAYADVCDEVFSILDSVCDVSSDRRLVEGLVASYNGNRLSPIHLRDCIEDSFGMF